MQSNFIFSLPETISFILAFIVMVYLLGSVIFTIFWEKQKPEEQRIQWRRQPRVIRNICLSLFPFLLVLSIAIDGLVAHYHLSPFITFISTFLGITTLLIWLFVFVSIMTRIKE